VFGGGVAPDSAAAGRWDTLAGGEYFAAGVGGAITGRRADLGLIDDPVKSREDADSDRGREKAWDWYVNDFVTRLKPGARQIIVMTRWHEDDLGGRVLERDRDRWHVLELPMEAMNNDPLGRQPGERLWAEWFTEDMVASAKMDVRAWHALYQQQPAGEDGDFFKLDWFREYDEPPQNMHIYGASDFAVTAGSGDYTEHGVFGIDQQGQHYLVDWWRGQETADVWIERLCDLIIKHGPMCWFGESGPIRRSIEPFLIRRMNERNARCRFEWLASIADKPTRCRAFQALASMGKVWVPAKAPWKADVVGQAIRFPAGRFDDAVDVLGLYGRGLEFVRAKPPARTVVKPPMYTHGAGGWMGR
jgi:predicted phage terminase large subunit-like protein